MTLSDLIKEHEYDELIFGGYLCLTCTPDGDTDATAWPCPPLRAAGMTDAHAVAHIENDRLRAKLERDRIELRDKRTDLLNIRGILSPNGYPRRVPMPLGDAVAPAVQWLVDEVERLRTGVSQLIDFRNLVVGERDRLRDERHRLQLVIAAVKTLTVSTDGDHLGHDEEIPVGEIVRVLADGGVS